MSTYKSQQGVALITSLILLVVMAVVGISTLNRGIMQGQMAFTHDEATMTFQAAEAGIEAVIDEQENMASAAVSTALQEALQAGQVDLTTTTNPVSCFAPVDQAAQRCLDHNGQRDDGACMTLSPDIPVSSWSRSVYLGEDPFLSIGGMSETVDSDVAMQAFLIQGCGMLSTTPLTDPDVKVAQTNQLSVSLLGPRQ